jgi:hypothetical protein
MKTKSRVSLLLATLIAFGMAAAPGVSLADPYYWGYRIVPAPPADTPVYIPVPPHRSHGGRGGDYQPHLTHAYRMGYYAGRQDRAWGMDRNYRRAFELSGSQWESYFQEGYADGYECRPLNH